MSNGHSSNEYRRRTGLVGPVILVTAGILLLLNNLGVLNWSIWNILFRMWPVILIAAGLDLLVGRRSAVGAVIALILILGVIGGGIWYAVTYDGVTAASGEPVEVAYSREGVTEAEITLKPGAGGVNVTGLDDGTDLILGTVRLHSGEDLERDFSAPDERAYLELESKGSWFLPTVGWGNQWTWDLALAEGVDLDLVVDMGVGETDLDLTDLQMEDLTVDLGIGRAKVILPAEGRFDARIDNGIGQIIVVVPEGMEVRVTGGAGLGSTNVPDGYESQDGAYVSPGYAGADNRVDLQVDVGIGSVDIRRQ
ncbi:MAG: LiaI-LiaF-like domain-containing protein [Anaerolineae bacterium]